MRKYYPDLVESYEESIKKPKKAKKAREKKNKENEDPKKPKRKDTKKKNNADGDVLDKIHNSLKRLSLDDTQLNTSKANVSVCVNKLKRKLRSNARKKNTIETYVLNKKKKYSVSKVGQCSFTGDKNTVNDSDENPLALPLNGADAMMDNFSFFNASREDMNDSELSDIIDQIVTRAPSVKVASVNSNLVRLVFEGNKKLDRRSIVKQSLMQNNCSTPNSSPLGKKKKSINLSKRGSFNVASKVNTSYFFDKLTDGCDAFEMSVENMAVKDIRGDLTVDYSLPEVHF